MKLLSKSLSFLFTIALIPAAFFYFHKAPCTSPITYRVGTFDTRFNIGREDFLSALKQAEDIWESATGKDLFKYDLSGKLPVNLIYDSRQETIDKNKVLESKVTATSQSADYIKAQFEALKSRFEQGKVDYQSMVDDFEARLAKYNSEVDMWNSKGGAPKSAYNNMTEEKNTLNSLRNILEKKRLEINAMGDEINSLIKKYNYLVVAENTTINEINKSRDKEFEQGEYISDSEGRRINIYEYDKRVELVRVLSHELGHALGLDHNDNPASIMYYLNKGKDLKLSSADIAAVNTLCKIE